MTSPVQAETDADLYAVLQDDIVEAIPADEMRPMIRAALADARRCCCHAHACSVSGSWFPLA